MQNCQGLFRERDCSHQVFKANKAMEWIVQKSPKNILADHECLPEVATFLPAYNEYTEGFL
jgi:hypothetical protein